MLGDQNASGLLTVYVSNNCQTVRCVVRSHIGEDDGGFCDNPWKLINLWKNNNSAVLRVTFRLPIKLLIFCEIHLFENKSVI